MVESAFAKSALLRHNYFPFQKKAKEELPPVFSTNTFLPEVAEELQNLKLRSGGYDECPYESTRFNNVHRTLSIPHPLPYAHLVSHICVNWDELKHICFNPNSAVSPQKHSDGRIIVMDYDAPHEKVSRYFSASRGKKFVVKTDISSCFPSIYTHAIPWALIGIPEAKANQHGGYANDLDKLQRFCKRNETSGIPIGPGTSNIIAELILEKIDKHLEFLDCKFVRYIDDYTAYCDSYEKAEKFILELGKILKIYKLEINIKKTSIAKLPQPTVDPWVSDISSRLSQREKLNEYYCIKILDYAVEMQDQHPDGSVLKYVAKILIDKCTQSAKEAVVNYVLNLSMHYPVLLPTLNSILGEIPKNSHDAIHQSLVHTLNECTKNRSSDGICWSLYYIIKYYAGSISDSQARAIVETGDCFSITLLSQINNRKKYAIDFSQEILSRSLYEIDSYWLLLYQLYLSGDINNPYQDQTKYSHLSNKKAEAAKLNDAKEMSTHDQKAFEIMKLQNVNFISTAALKAEKVKDPGTINNFFRNLARKMAKSVEAAAT